MRCARASGIVSLAARLLLAMGMVSPPPAPRLQRWVEGGRWHQSGHRVRVQRREHGHRLHGRHDRRRLRPGQLPVQLDAGRDGLQLIAHVSQQREVSAGAYTGTGVALWSVLRDSRQPVGHLLRGFLCKPISYTVGVTVDLGATELSNSNPLYSDLWVYSGSPGICPSSNFSVAKPRYLYQYN